MKDRFLQTLGRIHESIKGDGLTTLKRILTTCEEMLIDRGYVDLYRESDVLKSMEQSIPIMTGTDKEGKRTLVYVHMEDRVGIKFARSILEAMKEEENNTMVIISLEGPTPFTRKEFEGERIQFMLAKDVCVNKTRHVLVPRHEMVLHPPQGVKVEDLPKIPDSDPIVQYYNFRPGTIVRTMRTFGGHESVPYFRLVTAFSN